MAIIKCPECEKEISSESEYCIHCGYILNKKVTTNNKDYQLILIKTGKSKVAVLKAVREITGLGLVEAKELVDNIPSCITISSNYNIICNYANKLSELGAEVLIDDSKKELKDIDKICPVCGLHNSMLNSSCQTCDYKWTDEEINNANKENNINVKDENNDVLGGIIFAVIVFIIAGFLFNSCESGNSKYEDDLNNGIEKFYNGEKMTKDEHDAVESYHDWIDDNKEKTYDAWDN